VSLLVWLEECTPDRKTRNRGCLASNWLSIVLELALSASTWQAEDQQ